MYLTVIRYDKYRFQRPHGKHVRFSGTTKAERNYSWVRLGGFHLGTDRLGGSSRIFRKGPNGEIFEHMNQ